MFAGAINVGEESTEVGPIGPVTVTVTKLFVKSAPVVGMPVGKVVVLDVVTDPGKASKSLDCVELVDVVLVETMLLVTKIVIKLFVTNTPGLAVATGGLLGSKLFAENVFGTKVSIAL